MKFDILLHSQQDTREASAAAVHEFILHLTYIHSYIHTYALGTLFWFMEKEPQPPKNKYLVGGAVKGEDKKYQERCVFWRESNGSET